MANEGKMKGKRREKGGVAWQARGTGAAHQRAGALAEAPRRGGPGGRGGGCHARGVAEELRFYLNFERFEVRLCHEHAAGDGSSSPRRLRLRGEARPFAGFRNRLGLGRRAERRHCARTKGSREAFLCPARLGQTAMERCDSNDFQLKGYRH